jgi:hypothetical protein
MTGPARPAASATQGTNSVQSTHGTADPGHAEPMRAETLAIVRCPEPIRPTSVHLDAMNADSMGLVQ